MRNQKSYLKLSFPQKSLMSKNRSLSKSAYKLRNPLQNNSKSRYFQMKAKRDQLANLIDRSMSVSKNKQNNRYQNSFKSKHQMRGVLNQSCQDLNTREYCISRVGSKIDLMRRSKVHGKSIADLSEPSQTFINEQSLKIRPSMKKFMNNDAQKTSVMNQIIAASK